MYLTMCKLCVHSIVTVWILRSCGLPHRSYLTQSDTYLPQCGMYLTMCKLHVHSIVKVWVSDHVVYHTVLHIQHSVTHIYHSVVHVCI